MIWKINVPLHIKNFLWRVCSGFLPTVDRLATRRVFVHATCMVCNSVQETALHLLCDCPMAEDCWNIAGLSMDRVGFDNIQSWCINWLRKLSKEDQSLVAFLCWNLWINRNKAVWKQVVGSARTIVDAAGFQLSSWIAARSSKVELRGAVISSDDGVIKWKAPQHGWLKVNIDASVFPGRHRMGVGIVVRDWLGNIVQAKQCSWFCSYSPRMAEIMGIREALSWLKGHDKLIFESDAMDVVLEIRNPSLVESELILEDCVELAKQLDNIYFVFVRRSANQAAHVLAQYASSSSGHQEWHCHFPEFLTNVTAFDLI